MNNAQLFGLDSSHLAEWIDTRFDPEKKYLLHADMLVDWQTMIDAAAADGLRIVVLSGFRDFARQTLIWNEKFKGLRPVHDDAGHSLPRNEFSDAAWLEKILRYSALPGLSRHHWGSDIDVFDGVSLQKGHRPKLQVSEFCGEGPCAELDHWLHQRCGEFGFFRPYARDLGGVAPEPWHLSYAPVAVPALQQLDLRALAALITDTEIEAKALILAQLPHIFQRYACAISAQDQHEH